MKEMDKPVKIRGGLLARNTFFNLIGQGLPLVVAVITMPFVIRGLGTARFGILALSWVVLGYFSIFDLGLGRATTKFVAEAIGKGEQERIHAIILSMDNKTDPPPGTIIGGMNVKF